MTDFTFMQEANNFPDGPPVITSDFFSQAISQAQSQVSPSDVSQNM